MQGLYELHNTDTKCDGGVEGRCQCGGFDEVVCSVGLKNVHMIAETKALLDEGHKEILVSECYQDYGYPSYL